MPARYGRDGRCSYPCLAARGTRMRVGDEPVVAPQYAFAAMATEWEGIAWWEKQPQKTPGRAAP